MGKGWDEQTVDSLFHLLINLKKINSKAEIGLPSAYDKSLAQKFSSILKGYGQAG